MTAIPTSGLPSGSLAERFGADMDIVSLGFGDTAAATLLAASANERAPQISPDGRWLAYASDVSDKFEVYVRPYPGPGASELVSVGGGVEPAWSAGGRELVYRRGSEIMAIEVRAGSRFQAVGTPRELFSGSFDFSQNHNWDVSPDGRRFVMVRSDPATVGRLSVVLNWFEELKRK